MKHKSIQGIIAVYILAFNFPNKNTTIRLICTATFNCVVTQFYKKISDLFNSPVPVIAAICSVLLPV